MPKKKKTSHFIRRIDNANDAKCFLSLVTNDINAVVINGQKKGVIPKDNTLLDKWYIEQANRVLRMLGINH